MSWMFVENRKNQKYTLSLYPLTYLRRQQKGRAFTTGKRFPRAYARQVPVFGPAKDTTQPFPPPNGPCPLNARPAQAGRARDPFAPPWKLPEDWLTWKISWEPPLKNCVRIDSYKMIFGDGAVGWLNQGRATHMTISGPPHVMEKLLDGITVLAYMNGYLLPCLDVKVSEGMKELSA